MKYSSPQVNKCLRVGTFVKSGSPAHVEILALAGLDFVVIDAEHAPLDLSQLDMLLLACRAGGIPGLVRLPGHVASLAGAVLDLGAAGIVVPHVRDAQGAGDAVAMARYLGGVRGFSPSPRAAGYGRARFESHPAQADAEARVWCQIEDVDALANLDAIATVPGVDCLFIGPADLALSLGVMPGDAAWHEAIAAVAAAGRRHGVATCIAIASPSDAEQWRARGIDRFVCGSDQGFIAAGARRLRASIPSPILSGAT